MWRAVLDSVVQESQAPKKMNAVKMTFLHNNLYVIMASQWHLLRYALHGESLYSNSILLMPLAV